MMDWFERATATVGDLLLGSLFLLVSGAFANAAFVSRESLPIDAATVERAFRHEVALAASSGLVSVEDHRSAEPRVHREVALAPGECLSVVAATTGPQGVRDFSVRDAAGNQLGDEVVLHSSNVIRHLQWCSALGGRFTIDVEASVPPRLGLLRGTPSTPLHRVAPRPDLLVRLRTEIAHAALAPDGSIALAPFVQLSVPGQVLLLPSTPATRAALADAVLPVPGESIPALIRAPAALAALDAADAPPPPDARGRRRRPTAPAAPAVEAHAGPATYPLFRLLDDSLRVVAVVDRGALGAACVTLRFASTNGEAPLFWRSEVPGWSTAPLPVHDGAATDTSCTAQGLVVYAVRRDAPANEMLLSVRSTPAAPGAVATPSTWRGESTPHSLIARLDRACATDPSACRQLAQLADLPRSVGPRPDFTASMRRACDLSDASACGRLGVFLLGGRRDPAQAAIMLQRGCEGSDATACAILGEHRRRGDHGIPQDLNAAASHLETACRLGVEAACADRSAMRLLDLGPS